MYNETKLFSLLVIQYKYTRDIRYAIDDIRYIIYINKKFIELNLYNNFEASILDKYSVKATSFNK